MGEGHRYLTLKNIAGTKNVVPAMLFERQIPVGRTPRRPSIALDLVLSSDTTMEFKKNYSSYNKAISKYYNPSQPPFFAF